MLPGVLRHVAERRGEIMGAVSGEAHERVLAEARARWRAYEPSGRPAGVAGVDGSYNSVRYQGAALWAVTAAAVRAGGEVAASLHDVWLGGDGEPPAERMARMENEACCRVAGGADLVLADGSLRSRLISEGAGGGAGGAREAAEAGAVFVSKTSDAAAEFGGMGSAAGDMFYYGRASDGPGYSEPHSGDAGDGRPVSSVYARLGRSLPLIKIETAGGPPSGAESERLLDALAGNSVSGYPHALRLAHEACKVSREDMLRIEGSLGIAGETGARAVLA